MARWTTTGWLSGEGPGQTVPGALCKEWPRAQACLTPALTLLIGSFVVSDEAAVTIAMGVCLVQQAGWGVVIGRQAGLAGRRLVLSVAGFLTLAVLIAGLKALLH